MRLRGVYPPSREPRKGEASRSYRPGRADEYRGNDLQGRGRPTIWKVLALLLVALLIPLAGPALTSGGGGGESIVEPFRYTAAGEESLPGSGGISLVALAVVGGALILSAFGARLLWLWVSLLRSRRRGGS